MRSRKQTRTPYTPQRGDLIWINFSPQRGHEQAGRRPAVVLTPYTYNKRTGLAIVCPVTSRKKNYPFEVEVNSEKIKGFALADQIKSFDLAFRNSVFVGRLDIATVDEIANIAKDLILQ